MVMNHYGVWLNTDKPTTGVFVNNHVAYLSDDMFCEKALDATCLRCLQDDEYDCDFCGITDHEIVIGFKECDKEESVFKNINAKPDPDAEYQALVGESYTQVISSKYFIKGALCSPCYPGQVDADTEGDYLAYSFPPDMFDEDDPIRRRIFEISKAEVTI